MARAFHEAYGIRSTAYGKFATGVCYESAILDYRVCARNEDGPTFYDNVCKFAQLNGDKTVLVIGCGDSYVKLAAQYKDRFPANVIAPYIDAGLMDELTDKERFYELCDQYGIDHPATFVYRREMGHDFDLPFDPPYICKPSNGVHYWEHDFPGSEKVFTLPDRASLEATLDKVYAAGYPDAMIIQEFIPGDDSFMRVLTCYSDEHAQVKLMCLGHVLLEEHTPHGIGNHAVIITEPADGLSEKFKAFLEDVGFTGFSNFDIKYDQRDGKYKAFEINTRQGRSNYYVTQLLCDRGGPQPGQTPGGGPGGAQGPGAHRHPEPLFVDGGPPQGGLRLHPQALPPGDARPHPGGSGDQPPPLRARRRLQA